MTSKEKITNKINALKLDLEELDANDGWRGVIEHEIVQFENVLKDLEILEILKGVIFLTNNSYYIQTKKRLNEEDYKLIKEWLNNDK